MRSARVRTVTLLCALHATSARIGVDPCRIGEEILPAYVKGSASKLLRLTGGNAQAEPLISPEYAKVLQDPEKIQQGQAVGSIEGEDVCSRLPWPEGAEGKKESFEKYQKEYQQAKSDFTEVCNNLSVGSQQQVVHKITLKALGAMNGEAKAFVSHGRMFLQKDVRDLKSTLEYQAEKVLEEGICDLQDRKEQLATRIRGLETSMQEVLNHVFRGRFQVPFALTPTPVLPSIPVAVRPRVQLLIAARS